MILGLRKSSSLGNSNNNNDNKNNKSDKNDNESISSPLSCTTKMILIDNVSTSNNNNDKNVQIICTEVSKLDSNTKKLSLSSDENDLPYVSKISLLEDKESLTIADTLPCTEKEELVQDIGLTSSTTTPSLSTSIATPTTTTTTTPTTTSTTITATTSSTTWTFGFNRRKQQQNEYDPNAAIIELCQRRCPYDDDITSNLKNNNISNSNKKTIPVNSVPSDLELYDQDVNNSTLDCHTNTNIDTLSNTRNNILKKFHKDVYNEVSHILQTNRTLIHTICSTSGNNLLQIVVQNPDLCNHIKLLRLLIDISTSISIEEDINDKENENNLLLISKRKDNEIEDCTLLSTESQKLFRNDSQKDEMQLKNTNQSEKVTKGMLHETVSIEKEVENISIDEAKSAKGDDIDTDTNVAGTETVVEQRSFFGFRRSSVVTTTTTTTKIASKDENDTILDPNAPQQQQQLQQQQQQLSQPIGMKAPAQEIQQITAEDTPTVSNDGQQVMDNAILDVKSITYKYDTINDINHPSMNHTSTIFEQRSFFGLRRSTTNSIELTSKHDQPKIVESKQCSNGQALDNKQHDSKMLLENQEEQDTKQTLTNRQKNLQQVQQQAKLENEDIPVATTTSSTTTATTTDLKTKSKEEKTKHPRYFAFSPSSLLRTSGSGSKKDQTTTPCKLLRPKSCISSIIQSQQQQQQQQQHHEEQSQQKKQQQQQHQQQLPLHLAVSNCSHCSIEIITYLIRCDPLAVQTPNECQQNLPLHCVFYPSFLSSLSTTTATKTEIEEHAAVTQPSTTATVIHLPSIDVVKALVQQWPQSLLQQNKDGNVPLHLVVIMSVLAVEEVFTIESTKTGVRHIVDDAFYIDLWHHRYNNSTKEVSTSHETEIDNDETHYDTELEILALPSDDSNDDNTSNVTETNTKQNDGGNEPTMKANNSSNNKSLLRYFFSSWDKLDGSLKNIDTGITQKELDDQKRFVRQQKSLTLQYRHHCTLLEKQQAIAESYIKILQYLIENNPETLSCTNNDGYTPFDMALRVIAKIHQRNIPNTSSSTRSCTNIGVTDAATRHLLSIMSQHGISSDFVPQGKDHPIVQYLQDEMNNHDITIESIDEEPSLEFLQPNAIELQYQKTTSECVYNILNFVDEKHDEMHLPWIEMTLTMTQQWNRLHHSCIVRDNTLNEQKNDDDCLDNEHNHTVRLDSNAMQVCDEIHYDQSDGYMFQYPSVELLCLDMQLIDALTKIQNNNEPVTVEDCTDLVDDTTENDGNDDFQNHKLMDPNTTIQDGTSINLEDRKEDDAVLLPPVRQMRELQRRSSSSTSGSNSSETQSLFKVPVFVSRRKRRTDDVTHFVDNTEGIVSISASKIGNNTIAYHDDEDFPKQFELDVSTTWIRRCVG